MTSSPEKLAGGLYLVATPIGSARDITLRALDVLRAAEVLAAEDTRTLRHLMAIHDIRLGDRRILAYHDHNGAAMRPRLLQDLAAGKSVAYASEAGTPMVADPGYQLARAARDAGYMVTTAPGASAVIAALTVAALPTDRFLFAGFPPTGRGARQEWLAELGAVPATVVIYESPKRVQRLLTELVQQFGAEREAALCRELTKRFEEVINGCLGDLAQRLAERPVKGEIVLVIDRDRKTASAESMQDALQTALESQSVKDASATVALALGLPRRQVYQAALDVVKHK